MKYALGYYTTAVIYYLWYNFMAKVGNIGVVDYTLGRYYRWYITVPYSQRRHIYI